MFRQTQSNRIILNSFKIIFNQNVGLLSKNKTWIIYVLDIEEKFYTHDVRIHERNRGVKWKRCN